MLYRIKNHLWPCLWVYIALCILSLCMQRILGIEWNLALYPGFGFDLTVVMIFQVTSHVLIFFGLRQLFRQKFLTCYRFFIDLFRTQNIGHILAGGLLATAEEMVFRGIVLETLLRVVSTPTAIFVSSLFFVAAHVIQEKRLIPFLIWALFEGLILGTVYIMTGSLLIPMIVHFLNDSLGFSLMAYQRKTKWLIHV